MLLLFYIPNVVPLSGLPCKSSSAHPLPLPLRGAPTLGHQVSTGLQPQFLKNKFYLKGKIGLERWLSC